MAETKPVATWKSSEGRQKQAASLLESLPRLPLEHQEKLFLSWRENGNLQLKLSASWARARIEIPGGWENGVVPIQLAPPLTVVRPTWQTFLSTCAEDPIWEIHKDRLVWRSGKSRAEVPLEKAEGTPLVGTSKPVTTFPPEMVKAFRGLLPAAPRDYIQLELHGVLVGKGFLASTDGLVLAFVPKIQCTEEVLIPSELLSWSEFLPGCSLGVCASSFLVFSEGVVVEQPRFAEGKTFPIDRVIELRNKVGEAKLSGVLFSNQEFVTALRHAGQWRMAGGSRLRLRGGGREYHLELPIPGAATLSDLLTTEEKYPAVDYQFDGKNLLLWAGIAAGLDGKVSIATGDKLPYRLRCGRTELYLVKPG